MIIIETDTKINPLDQKNYDLLIRTIDFSTIECPECHHHDWKVHAYYDRHIDSSGCVHVIRILRVRCACCQATHAVLVQDMVPYSIADHALIVRFILGEDFSCSSHVHFLRRKYPSPSISYREICSMNARGHPIYFHTAASSHKTT